MNIFHATGLVVQSGIFFIWVSEEASNSMSYLKKIFALALARSSHKSYGAYGLLSLLEWVFHKVLKAYTKDCFYELTFILITLYLYGKVFFILHFFNYIIESIIKLGEVKTTFKVFLLDYCLFFLDVIDINSSPSL